MILRGIFLSLALLAALSLAASGPHAQLTTTGAGSKAGGVIPPVACNAGQLDFTDACGTTQYMVLLK